MRINILAPYDSFSGGLRVIALYAELLVDRGHQVTLVHGPRPQPSIREYLRAMRHGRWLEFREKNRPIAGHLSRCAVDQVVLPEARPICSGDVPDGDVIIATWWETAVWMNRMPSSKGFKVHLIQGNEKWGDAAMDRMIDDALRLPNLKIAVSNSLRAELERDLGPLGIRVVANAVDINQFDAPPRPRNDRPRVGFVYSQAHMKGVDRYRAVIREARRALPDLEVLAFGADEVSSAAPLPNDTTFFHRPHQSDIPGIYAKCDAWLFASRVDSFGLPLLEAMACRTPVISLPVGAAPDLLKGFAHGLVEVADESEIGPKMGQALVRLLNEPEDNWLQLSGQAYALARSYTWTDAAAELEALIDSAMKQQSEDLGHCLNF